MRVYFDLEGDTGRLETAIDGSNGQVPACLLTMMDRLDLAPIGTVACTDFGVEGERSAMDRHIEKRFFTMPFRKRIVLCAIVLWHSLVKDWKARILLWRLNRA